MYSDGCLASAACTAVVPAFGAPATKNPGRATVSPRGLVGEQEALATIAIQLLAIWSLGAMYPRASVRHGPDSGPMTSALFLPRSAQPGGIQRRSGQRIAAVPAHAAKPPLPPVSDRRRDLLRRARDEVPPHQQGLPERDAAQQQQPGASRRLYRNLLA